MALVYLPLATVFAALLFFAVASVVPALDRVVSRVALATFGPLAGDQQDVNPEKVDALRGAHVPQTYRLYAARTYLFATTAALAGAILGVYLVAGVLVFVGTTPESFQEQFPAAVRGCSPRASPTSPSPNCSASSWRRGHARPARRVAHQQGAVATAAVRGRRAGPAHRHVDGAHRRVHVRALPERDGATGGVAHPRAEPVGVRRERSRDGHRCEGRRHVRLGHPPRARTPRRPHAQRRPLGVLREPHERPEERPAAPVVPQTGVRVLRRRGRVQAEAVPRTTRDARGGVRHRLRRGAAVPHHHPRRHRPDDGRHPRLPPRDRVPPRAARHRRLRRLPRQHHGDGDGQT